MARLEAVVAPVLEAQGLSLVGLEWRREGRRWVFRLSVDRQGGVRVSDCQRLSREVGDLLEASGLIPESYDLEVSSPGLTRELRTEREWRWAQGKKIKCWIAGTVGGRTEFTGRLAEVTDSTIRLEGDDGTVQHLERRQVTRARLDPDLGR
jgi:ribosome maturation factor RimP